MGNASSCETCGTAVAGGESWLTLQGETVCRRCYYADQTKLQARRIEESEQELGMHGTYSLGKRMLVGAALILIGGAALFGALRAGHWSDAAWPALVVALGIIVVTVSIRAARPPTA